jgi:hypothetical protein
MHKRINTQISPARVMNADKKISRREASNVELAKQLGVPCKQLSSVRSNLRAKDNTVSIRVAESVDSGAREAISSIINLQERNIDFQKTQTTSSLTCHADVANNNAATVSKLWEKLQKYC